MTPPRCVMTVFLGILLSFILHQDALVASYQDLRGKQFVFAFPPTFDPSQNVFQVVLTSCSSNNTTTVNVSMPTHELQYFSTHIMRNTESLTVTLPKKIAANRNVFFMNGTIVISANNDITVVAVSGQTRTMATFSIIPTASLGQEYVVISYANPAEDNSLPDYFVVSPLEEKTNVRINLTGDALPFTDLSNRYFAAEEFSLDLLPFNSVLFRGAKGLTGTRIWSDKPVSVLSGNACVFIPNDVYACDHIVEHIPPVNRWGRRYIVPPFMGRHSGYIYRVVASRPLTRVTYADRVNSTVFLNAGEYIERNINSEIASLITSDKPVLLAQYSKGNFSDGIGDPAMIIITPVEQFVQDAIFAHLDVLTLGIEKEYMSVITLCDDVDKLRLNSLPMEELESSSLRLNANSDFCIVRNTLSEQGVYTVTSVNHEAEFAVFVYGFGNRIAYAHPVGFGQRELTCKIKAAGGGLKEKRCKPPDKEPPVIFCPENQELFAVSGHSDLQVTWDAPTVTDNSGQVFGINATHLPGASFLIGTTAVTYTAWDEEGNARKCSFNVTVYAWCPTEVTGSAVLLSWPTTMAGHTAESNERCPVNTDKRGYALARRYCSPDSIVGAQWDNAEPQTCGTSTEEVQLQDLQQTPVVEDNVQEVAEALLEASQDTGTIKTPEDVSAIATTLEHIVSVKSSSTEVTTYVIEVIDNFIDLVTSDVNTGDILYDESVSDMSSSSTSILHSLENQISLSLQAGHQIRQIEPNLAVEGIQLKNNTSQGALSFAVLASNTRFLEDGRVRVFKNTSHIPFERVETSIQLPQTIFYEIEKDLQISFMVFQNDALFPSEKTRNGSNRIIGSIISAAIDDVSVSNLSEPVVIEFAPTKVSPSKFKFNLNTTGCYFYDTDARDWSRDGCEVMSSDEFLQNGRMVCHCNHLTNFAVIMDLTGQSVIDNEQLSFALDVISKLGCVMSIVALAITLFVFLLFRRLRANRPRRILIHFCFSLVFLYLIFLAGIDASTAASGCTVVAALLHYFTLTTVFWMGVEARNMYVSLVKVFDAAITNFMVWACVVGWGVPLLVVVVTLIVLFHQYRSQAYCFLSAGSPLHYGLLLPVGIVLLHNFVIFGLVMRRLLRANLGGTVNEKSRAHQINMRLQNALAISVLLGLTWVFGFLAIDEATFVFQLLFCFFNSFQGVIVFLMFCLRQDDVRKTLKPYFTWIKCPKWTLPEWKAVPTKANRSSTGSAAPSSPTNIEHDTATDMASTTDISLSELHIPLNNS